MKPRRQRRSPKAIREAMARVRTKGTHPELLVRNALRREGISFRSNVPALPGSPDLVIPKYKIAVFVDGDLWHGRLLILGRKKEFALRVRGKKRVWWLKKIEGNIRRDRRITRQLRSLGWAVVRIWESRLSDSLDVQIARIARKISERRTMTYAR